MEVDKPALCITLSPDIYILFDINIHGRPSLRTPLLWEYEKRLPRDEYKHVYAQVYIVELMKEFRTVTVVKQTPEYMRSVLSENAKIERGLIGDTLVEYVTK